jgi:F0F1-type ATP synthase, subunit a
MEVGTVFDVNIFNHAFAVTSSIVTQWIIMAFIIILTLIFTRNLNKIPDKSQSVIEMIVTTVNGLVSSNMGNEYKRFFVPYVGTLAVFLTFLNLSGLVGIEPSTKDINVTLTFALMTFFLINGNAIKKKGLGGYLKGYVEPYAPMLPLNMIEKLTIPFSLCLRLFCNMLVGAMVLGLVYSGLGHFAFIIPIPIHFFFDVFDGLIQMFVFIMLTMVYTKIGASH